MEIQLRCDQVESVKKESINVRVNPPQRGTGDNDDGDGPDRLYCRSCVTRRFNGHPCQHPHPHSHMALHQHSCWRSVKPLCQGATHTLTKSLMAPVKTMGRSLAASLILSPNYCWGRAIPCIPIAGLSQADKQEGQISPRLPPFSFCGNGR